VLASKKITFWCPGWVPGTDGDNQEVGGALRESGRKGKWKVFVTGVGRFVSSW